jgi:hypothetical protein
MWRHGFFSKKKLICFFQQKKTELPQINSKTEMNRYKKAAYESKVPVEDAQTISKSDATIEIAKDMYGVSRRLFRLRHRTVFIPQLTYRRALFRRCVMCGLGDDVQELVNMKTRTYDYLKKQASSGHGSSGRPP